MKLEKLIECPHCKGKGRVAHTIGAELKAVRKRAKITLREMGERLGFSFTYINEIERENRRCPPSVLEAYERLGNSKTKNKL